jgi:Protein of unknown function (DUF2516)
MGPDLVIALAVLFLFVVVPLWSILDAVKRPTAAFEAAGSNKTAWVVVLVVSLVIGVGTLLGGYYLLFIRPKVRAHTGATAI